METFGTLMEKNRGLIEDVLPGYMTRRRWFALALTVEKNPLLTKCTPSSLFAAVLKCAEWGLEIGGPDDHVVLIPYRGPDGTYLVQAQPMYRGIIYRAIRAGIASHIYAEVVYEHDEIRIFSGSRRELIHRPKLTGDRGELSYCYAVVLMPNGVTDFELLDLDDLKAIKDAALRMAQRHDKTAGLSPAWRYFEGEMFKKSAIRRLVKRLQGARHGADDDADRLAAVLRADNTDFDFEQEKEAQPPVDDMPKAEQEPPLEHQTSRPTTEKRARAKRGRPAAPPNSVDTTPISDADIDQIDEVRSTVGMSWTVLKGLLKDQFAVSDLTELHADQVTTVSAAIAKWAQTS